MPPLQSHEAWLGRAAAILVLTIPVDCETVVLSEGRRYGAHPLPMSHQLYEIARGLPRLLALLAELELSATFFVPGWTLERHPQVAQAILANGHELAHHTYAHRRATALNADEERRDFERALEVLESFGVRPCGHRAAYWATTWQTLELVAEHALLYDCSLMGHDRPYRLSTPRGELLELPAHWLLDDFDHYAYLPAPRLGENLESPRTVMALWRAELDALRRLRGLCQLTCHAFLSGRPGRALALRGLLEYVSTCGDVEVLTCEQVARRAVRDRELEMRTYSHSAQKPSSSSRHQ